MSGEYLKNYNFWFGIIGVFGTIFGIYQYISSLKVGRISYQTDTQKVFDPANLAGFTLVAPEKKEIKNQVFATELTVWNSGDISIGNNAERIREPLTVKIHEPAEIYYFIVSKANIVPIDNFRMTTSEDKRSITINWRFLDPGQGVRMTVIHSGANEENSLTVAGRFYEAPLVQEPRRAPNKPSPYLLMGLSVAIIVAGILLYVLNRILTASRAHEILRENRNMLVYRFLTGLLSVSMRKITSLLYVVFGLGFFIFSIYQIFSSRTPPL